MSAGAVGFLGPGSMGAPMVGRLLARDIEVLVWGRNRERLEPLVGLGARAVEHPVGVLEADVVVGCLLDADALRAIYLGPDGLVQHARPGQVFVEHATVDPAVALEIGSLIVEAGATYLDAPVSGGPDGAAAGTLVTMVGGDARSLEGVEHVLSCYCSKIVHAGEAGRGLTLKLINQLLVAAHAVAAAEAAALIIRSGIHPDAAHAALMHGWAASRMLDLQLPRALAHELGDDGASLGKFAHALDDVRRLVVDAGMASELLPAIGAAFDGAIRNGFGDAPLAGLVGHYQGGVAA